MNRIIVTRIESKIITCKYDDFKLKRISVSDADNTSILGNIYVAKVQNIVKNINAAFVEIANKTLCYLDLREINKPIFLNSKKNDSITVGDEILVQVIKDVWQKKAPVVTTSISIKGDNVILTYGKNNIGISNKITDSVRREEISKLFNVYKNDAYGFVIRTSASEQNDEYLIQEIELLKKKYNEIVDKANFSTCFSCIYKNYDEFICDIKEMIDKNVEEIVIEDDNLYGIVLDILPCINKGFNINLRHYIDKTLSLVKLYSVEANIAGLLKERVWLKSGANIVIQHTEALTVIDVNTSKSIKVKGNYADTFLKINKEAAKEIANQLSLRNIGGIIIIDFIDMKREEDKSELINYLQKYLYMDYIKTVFVDMTKLNLVEITRKKVKSPLSKQVKEIYNVLEKYK